LANEFLRGVGSFDSCGGVDKDFVELFDGSGAALLKVGEDFDSGSIIGDRSSVVDEIKIISKS